MDTNETAEPAIVMIHGLWMTSLSWEHWAERYRALGRTVIAEDWPGMDVGVEALRRNPEPIAGLGIAAIVDHYDRIIRALDQPPIIMGHSFGGAFVQVLLDRGLGCAGVAVDSAAVKGVTKLPFSTLRTGWPILRNPGNRGRAVPISLKQFHYRFTNHLSVEESAPLYERYCVPAAGRVLFEGAGANFNAKCGHEGGLPQGGSCTAAVHRRGTGPCESAVAQQGERQEVRRVDGRDRLSRVRRPLALHPRPRGLGGRRRPCPDVGECTLGASDRPGLTVMDLMLRDKVAVVTGAGKGIGLAMTARARRGGCPRGRWIA